MTQTDRLLKELILEVRLLRSEGQEYIDGQTAIKLLGRSNQRELKYIREHFLKDSFRQKNGCTFEYQKKAILELKRKMDSGQVQLNFRSKAA